MTVGFYSPLPPARTGVSDYACTLLAELRKYGRVEVGPRDCDLALYHLGNNELHGEIYQKALERPGVVVLHDALLHHFLLGRLSGAEYVEEFVYNYGEWNRGLARELWRGRAGSGSDSRYFEYPMLKRVAERARAVVVHNPAAARTVREHAPGARVEEIAHLFAPPELPGEVETIRYRQRLGIDIGDFVFGAFGYLRESKRLVTILEAFQKVHREYPRTTLLVAGEFVSTDLERAVEPLLEAGGVKRLPHLPEDEFWLAARAVDACINLRYPAAGETSGIAIRLMGIGKPVMMTESLECSRFPEGCCLRIDSGPAEREAVERHMVLLLSMAEVAHAVGERGAAHIKAHHRVELIGREYWRVLEQAKEPGAKGSVG